MPLSVGRLAALKPKVEHAITAQAGINLINSQSYIAFLDNEKFGSEMSKAKHSQRFR